VKLVRGVVFTTLFAVAAGACGGASPRATTATHDEGAQADAGAATSGAWSDEESPVPVSSADPVWGDRSAPVTLVELSDLQCPFCARAEPTIEALKAKYGPKTLRVVWKNLPLSFHKDAALAAESAEGVFELAGIEAFHRFVGLVFANQSKLSAEAFVGWARDAGVTDTERFERGLWKHEWASKVAKDTDLAKKLGVAGTPHFFINGVSLSGAQPIGKFEALIDQELAKAKAKLAAGVPADRIYVESSKASYKAAQEEDEEEEDTTTVWKIPIDGRPAIGAKTPLVTIVEFSDFQCPYCARVEPTLKKILDTYPNEVRLVWRNEPLPFHTRAEPAAQLALEARAQKGDAGFWQAHDKLFEAQQDLSDPALESIASSLGLDVAKARDAIRTHKHKASLEEDAEVVEDFQAAGTPHFFINGRRLIGAQPFERFKAIIDEEIKVTQLLVNAGIDPAVAYQARTEAGETPPPLEKIEAPIAPRGAPTKGNPAAKVTVQMFSDFQCPFCARVEPTLKDVEKEFGTEIKIVWRHMPLSFHENAHIAAEASVEALKQRGPTAFWKMHDLLFANQKDLGRASLSRYARQVGLDVARFDKALDAGTHKAVVDADIKAAQDANIHGTPTFLVNGYVIAGAQPLAKFRKVIRQAVKDTKSPAGAAAKRATP
jgi:protein-disulfide isomerase